MRALSRGRSRRREQEWNESRERWVGQSDFPREDYNRAARQFYDPPTQGSTAVVETVFRKPKVYADLHEYDEIPDIDRVPTAIGFHSMDSFDEINEARSRASRYGLEDERDDQVEAEAEKNPASKSRGFDEESEVDDIYDRYRRQTQGQPQTVSSMWSNDSDSCPAIWKSFSDEHEERDANWALEEAKRRQALNSVTVPAELIAHKSDVESIFEIQPIAHSSSTLESQSVNSTSKSPVEQTQVNSTPRAQVQRKKRSKSLTKRLGLGKIFAKQNCAKKTEVVETPDATPALKAPNDSRSLSNSSIGQVQRYKVSSSKNGSTTNGSTRSHRSSNSRSSKSRQSSKGGPGSIQDQSYGKSSKPKEPELSTLKEESKRIVSSRKSKEASKSERLSSTKGSDSKKAHGKQFEKGEDGSGSTKNSIQESIPDDVNRVVRGQGVGENETVSVVRGQTDDDGVIRVVRGQGVGEDATVSDDHEQAEDDESGEDDGVVKAIAQEQKFEEGGITGFVRSGLEGLSNLGYTGNTFRFLDWGAGDAEIAELEKQNSAEDGSTILELQSRNEENRSKGESTGVSFTLDGWEEEQRQTSNKGTNEHEEGNGPTEKSRERVSGASAKEKKMAVTKPTEVFVKTPLDTPMEVHVKKQDHTVPRELPVESQRGRRSRGAGSEDNKENGRNDYRSSEESKEVVSLTLDGQGGANDDASVVSISIIQIPTPREIMNAKEDSSMSILGLERQHKKRYKSRQKKKQIDYPEPAPLKPGKRSFLGRLRARRGS